MNELVFPDKFLWGAGTSAFQVEGNVKNSDWWRWEQYNQPPELRSGRACDHYNRYIEDFDLVKELGHNAHRFSLEWSRIEPEPGVFDQREVNHYKNVVKSLRDRDITPIVTLHHFTNSAWFAEQGGWESREAPAIFDEYVRNIVPPLRDAGADLWISINEPSVYSQLGFLTGEFAPQKKSFPAYCKVLLNMSLAHRKAYKTIHMSSSSDRVGIANAMCAFEPVHNGLPLKPIEDIGVKVLNKQTNRLVYYLTGNTHDFLGINYYFGLGISAFPFQSLQLGGEKSMLGWGVYPEGLKKVIQRLKLPIYITENGIATNDDSQRERFLVGHLIKLHEAIQNGADVRGYFHWSFMDNMELHRGFEPRFGLVGVDFNSPDLTRQPKPSAYLYRKIIQGNRITPEMQTIAA